MKRVIVIAAIAAALTGCVSVQDFWGPRHNVDPPTQLDLYNTPNDFVCGQYRGQWLGDHNGYVGYCADVDY